MAKASKIFYTIGRIFNIVELISTALVFVVGIILTALHGQIADGNADMDKAGALAMGLTMLIAGIVGFIVSLVIYFLAKKASKSLGNGVQDTAPHVIMLVIGIIGDIFYLLGGIFGLIAEGREDER